MKFLMGLMAFLAAGIMASRMAVKYLGMSESDARLIVYIVSAVFLLGLIIQFVRWIIARRRAAAKGAKPEDPAVALLRGRVAEIRGGLAQLARHQAATAPHRPAVIAAPFRGPWLALLGLPGHGKTALLGPTGIKRLVEVDREGPRKSQPDAVPEDRLRLFSSPGGAAYLEVPHPLGRSEELRPTWLAALKLLRGRSQPLHGVVLAVSAEDLATDADPTKRAAQAHWVAAADGDERADERGERLGELAELAHEGEEAGLGGGLGLAEAADGPQAALIEEVAEGVEAAAQLLQHEVVAAAVGQLEAEGLTAAKPAEWRVPVRPMRLPMWLGGVALLFSMAMLCSYRGELGDDAELRGALARVGVGAQVLRADREHHAVQRLAAAAQQLERGEPGRAQLLAAGERVRDLEIGGAAGGGEQAQAVLGNRLGRALARALAVDLDEPLAAGRAEQGGLAVTGHAEQREPGPAKRRGDHGGAARGGRGLMADELVERGALLDDPDPERGDGRILGLGPLGGGPATRADPAKQLDDHAEQEHRADEVDDQPRVRLGDAEVLDGHARGDDARGHEGHQPHD